MEESIDEHIQNIIKLHFDDKHGAPYWINKKEELSFDPEKEIKTKEDLQKFAEDENYDGFPTERMKKESQIFVPKKFDKSEYQMFSSGGRTGNPKWTAFVNEGGWKRIKEELNEHLDDDGFKRGKDWAYIGPTGPHAYGHFVKEFASQRNGNFFTIDLDPRWVRNAKVDKDLREKGVADDYISHLKDQTIDIFKQHGKDLGTLVSTPSVIGMLAQSGALQKLPLDGVIFAGQAMEPENYEFLSEELDGELKGFYGNTLIGVSYQQDFKKTDGEDQILYQPEEGLAIYDIVEGYDKPLDEIEKVDYGERGRTMVHILREGLFAPYTMEDDAATRLEPTEGYEIDAVGNPDIPEEYKEEIETGVY